MSNIATSTSSNIFYQARCKASAHNDQLKSREGAADIMLIDRGRLYRIESGLANPYPEEIVLMSDLYGAPELRNYFCTTTCPLGKNMPKIEAVGLDRISLKALSSFGKIKDAKKLLLDITADGVIEENEKPALDKIVKTLDEITQITLELKTWIEKNLN